MDANVFIRNYFLKSALSVKLRSFMIEQYAPLLSLFLIQRLAHFFFFCFVFPLMCSWLSNKLPQAIIKKSISLLLSMSAIFKKHPLFLHKVFVLKNIYSKVFQR